MIIFADRWWQDWRTEKDLSVSGGYEWRSFCLSFFLSCAEERLFFSYKHTWVPLFPSCMPLPTARIEFPAVFGLRVLDGLPLNIGNRIGAAACERHNVILDVTRTCASRAPGRRTGVLSLEFAGYLRNYVANSGSGTIQKVGRSGGGNSPPGSSIQMKGTPS